MSLEDYQRKLAYILYPDVFEENKILKSKLDNGKDSLPKPDTIATINSKELREMLNTSVDKVHILDRNFVIPSTESWDAFLEANGVDKKIYLPDTYDCDNYGVELAVAAKNWLPGCACGLIMDYSHAWFFIILQKDGELYIDHVEPQTDGDVNKKHLDGDLYMAWAW